ncbi:MAG: hypothetical protein ABR975_00840 [Vulcanimicrobiaceae bacterium]
MTNGQTQPQTLLAINTALLEAYLAGNQSDKAVALAQQLHAADPNNAQITNILASVYLDRATHAATPAEAVADYEQVAQLVPDKAAVSYENAAVALGNAAKTADEFKAALAELKKALALVPNDAQANYTAAVLSGNAGDSASARAYLATAKTNVGDNLELAAKINDLGKKLGPK